MTIGSWLKSATTKLHKVGVGSARLDAELIAAHLLDVVREQILAHPERELTSDQQTKLNNLLITRAKRQPLVHLTGKREFYGLELAITPDVLTPRVETERMVELAIEKAPKNGSLLDVGTGSGAIAIAIAKHRPDLGITASDLSSSALKVAKRNAKQHEAQIRLVKSNLLEQIEGSFDVITANLPYLKDDADLMPEVGYEPEMALLGGPDGLDLYRKFFRQLPDHLKYGGLVLIEADPWQHEALIKLAAAINLKPKTDDYFILCLQNAS